ncbi:MAG: winged helix-turn-helix domain-containing protein [Solirubrobacterales bacterium]|nr:winged helix-turn-helix domain-containing protein [Solirubrobacterales bacterium]
MDYRILGRLEVSDGDRRIEVGGDKQRALLMILLLHAGEIVSADRLIDDLWGERPPPAALGALQTHISRLRKVLDRDLPGSGHANGDPGGMSSDAVLVTRGHGYLLRLAPGELDVDRFRELVEQGRAALAAGQPAKAAAVLRDALRLWRGPPLADCTYEAFAQAPIAQLEELHLGAVEDRAEADLALGRHGELVAELRALVEHHPLRERLRGELMLALYRCGRQAEALEMYQEFRRALSEQLGLEPGPSLQQLELAILARDPSLDRPPSALGSDEPPAGSPASPDTEPVERPTVTGFEPQHNLPAQVSSFVGRDREVSELRGLLSERRTLTLTGAGGVGKTRLALEVAASLLDGSGDGVWFVDFAPLADASLVAATAATVLAVGEEPGRSPRDMLITALRNRRLLLILDNCEHVIDEAASLADQLISACPGIAILATSREPLRIAGEQLYRVPSLALPTAGVDDPERLLDSAAVRLFVDRANQQRPGFALDRDNAGVVARLCRRLDGIPLAIELAAARLRSLSLSNLEARLDQRFRLLTGGSRTALPRQQTLEALIDWSYNLLSATEQEVLEHLSVFPGSFNLESTDAVASPRHTGSVLDEVVALVDKSLIQWDDTTNRYRLLESVREYAAARLLARSADAARAAHAAHRDHYVALAETARPHLIGHGQAQWLDRLEPELDNLRAAISECASDPDPEPGLRLADALRYFWAYRRPRAEGPAAVCAALDRPGARASTLACGRALIAAGHLLAEISAQYDAAVACLHEAAAIARALSDEHLRTDSLHWLLAINAARGDEETHEAFADEGLRAARALGDPHLTAQMLMASASSTRVAHSQSLRRFNEALALARETGDQVLSLRALAALGYTALYAGEVSLARARLDEAVRLFRAIGDQTGLSRSACNLGFALYVDGADAHALAMFDETLQIARRNGDWLIVAYAQLGRALVQARAGDARGAATLHGTADALHDKLGTRLLPVQSRLRDADIAALRATLGDEAFDLAYNAGRTTGASTELLAA